MSFAPNPKPLPRAHGCWKAYAEQLRTLPVGQEMAITLPEGCSLGNAAKGVRNACREAGVAIHTRTNRELDMVWVRRQVSENTGDEA